ncbi:hypothetical protein PVK06_010480 [Gossypium arboreum]|uniref:PAP/OAS1 substrate-binding-related domain-containing protein n=1 Tax=Gossypium arboreum TaxID=29729 RepID=A0ABR0Q648_GOSAR|nr:hypothetical protein PVK06_010480 [Gossypium arboreum]
MEENLARYICSILQDNQQNSEVLVQDVQYIRAQVKIVKCTVNDIPVDISFNQTAGLSALCFLEKVDQLIGKDHLFKRSIILIKAWCYYESRILGAHHGLLSTYALETMILYTINYDKCGILFGGICVCGKSTAKFSDAIYKGLFCGACKSAANSFSGA